MPLIDISPENSIKNKHVKNAGRKGKEALGVKPGPTAALKEAHREHVRSTGGGGQQHKGNACSSAHLDNYRVWQLRSDSRQERALYRRVR